MSSSALWWPVQDNIPNSLDGYDIWRKYNSCTSSYYRHQIVSNIWHCGHMGILWYDTWWNASIHKNGNVILKKSSPLVAPEVVIGQLSVQPVAKNFFKMTVPFHRMFDLHAFNTMSSRMDGWTNELINHQIDNLPLSTPLRQFLNIRTWSLLTLLLLTEINCDYG